MYQIKCDDLILYDPRAEELVVYNPRCALEANTAGEASFTIFADHPYYGYLQKKRSIFEILQDGETIFRGRMTEDTNDFNNTKSVDLEGVLTFFNDSIVRPFAFPDDFQTDAGYLAAAEAGNVVEYFLSWLIDKHNEQVQPFQRFKLGRVTVSDPNNYLSRSSVDYLSTWEILKTRLFESAIGGYICIRYENDGNYIDYLSRFDEINAQRIEYGENLLDFTSESDAAQTYSACVPLGKKDETTEKPLTIAAIADGDIDSDIVKSGDMLYSKSAVEKFGFVCAPASETTWEDVTNANNLLQRGTDFMNQTATKFVSTITIKAFDLHFSNAEIEAFRIYRNTFLLSAVHGYENSLELTRLEIDIQNPQNTIITLGDMQLSLTDINAGNKQNVDAKFESQQNDIVSQVKKIAEETYNSQIEQLSKKITLSVSGSLGDKAVFELTVGDVKNQTEWDLTKIRDAFAKDKSSVTVSAGVITFNSGTIIINSGKFSVDALGKLTATDAIISGEVTTISGSYKTELNSGSLELYYSDNLCGTINTKYWSGASTEGISLRIEEAGKYIMFSHPSNAGTGYDVDYYLNYGWSTNYDEKHIFQTSARFLSDVYLDGKTDIGSLRLRGAGGKRYLVTANDNGTVTCSVI